MIIDGTDNVDYFIYKFNLSKKDQKRLIFLNKFNLEKNTSQTFSEKNLKLLSIHFLNDDLPLHEDECLPLPA